MKYTILFIVLIISSLQISGQKLLNEFSIYGGGGFSFFHIQPAVNNATSAGFSADIGVGYTHFFNQQLGFHLGAGFGLYNVTNKIDRLNFVTNGLYDSNNYLYNLHSTMTDYRENHSAIFLSIPLMLQFQSKQTQWDWKREHKIGFYTLFGIKALILPNSNYETGLSTLYNAAYYPEFDNWADSQTFAGLGHFDGKSNNGYSKLCFLPVLAFEAGIKRRITDYNFLYIGAFLDYALTDPAKDIRKLPNDYTAELIALNDDFMLMEFAEAMNLTTVGIKMRWIFTQLFNSQKKKSIYDCNAF